MKRGHLHVVAARTLAYLSGLHTGAECVYHIVLADQSLGFLPARFSRQPDMHHVRPQCPPSLGPRLSLHCLSCAQLSLDLVIVLFREVLVEHSETLVAECLILYGVICVHARARCLLCICDGGDGTAHKPDLCSVANCTHHFLQLNIDRSHLWHA